MRGLVEMGSKLSSRREHWTAMWLGFVARVISVDEFEIHGLSERGDISQAHIDNQVHIAWFGFSPIHREILHLTFS